MCSMGTPQSDLGLQWLRSGAGCSASVYRTEAGSASAYTCMGVTSMWRVDVKG